MPTYTQKFYRLLFGLGFSLAVAAACSPRQSSPRTQGPEAASGPTACAEPTAQATHQPRLAPPNAAHRVPAGHGTVVLLKRSYCGGARPSEGMLERYRSPMPCTSCTLYILPRTGPCPERDTDLSENSLPPMPTGAIAAQTDAEGHLILSRPLRPGDYCLLDAQGRSCDTAYETESGGSHPACFTVRPGGLLPDTLVIRQLCGYVPRP